MYGHIIKHRKGNATEQDHARLYCRRQRCLHKSERIVHFGMAVSFTSAREIYRIGLVQGGNVSQTLKPRIDTYITYDTRNQAQFPIPSTADDMFAAAPLSFLMDS